VVIYSKNDLFPLNIVLKENKLYLFIAIIFNIFIYINVLGSPRESHIKKVTECNSLKSSEYYLGPFIQLLIQPEQIIGVIFVQIYNNERQFYNIGTYNTKIDL